MAEKRFTAVDVAEHLAGKSGLTIDQVKALLTAQAELAYANVTRGFPIPGLGVLTKVEAPERKMVMRFGPRMGKEVVLPAKRKLTFRISGVAKAMILGPPQPIPDLFKPLQIGDFKYSCEATELSDPSAFIAGLGGPFTLARDHKPVSMFFFVFLTYAFPRDAFWRRTA
jgi:hypothetical protein